MTRGDGRLEFFYFEKSMFSVIAIHPAEQLLQLRLMGLALYEAFFMILISSSNGLFQETSSFSCSQTTQKCDLISFSNVRALSHRLCCCFSLSFFFFFIKCFSSKAPGKFLPSK